MHKINLHIQALASDYKSGRLSLEAIADIIYSTYGMHEQVTRALIQWSHAINDGDLSPTGGE